MNNTDVIDDDDVGDDDDDDDDDDGDEDDDDADDDNDDHVWVLYMSCKYCRPSLLMQMGHDPMYIHVGSFGHVL